MSRGTKLIAPFDADNGQKGKNKITVVKLYLGTVIGVDKANKKFTVHYDEDGSKVQHTMDKLRDMVAYDSVVTQGDDEITVMTGGSQLTLQMIYDTEQQFQEAINLDDKSAYSTLAR